MTPSIALLLKAPRPGHVKTRLAADIGEAAAREVYIRLAERQVAALPASWPVTIHFAPEDAESEMRSWLGPIRQGLKFIAQGPGDLGARLRVAFATEWALASGATVAIGGDCPALDSAIFEEAAAAQMRSDVVLGSTLDGGYYLISLKAPHPELFVGIDWSTPAVLEQTRARIREFGLSLALLPMLEDIDDAESLERAAPILGQKLAGGARRQHPTPVRSLARSNNEAAGE